MSLSFGDGGAFADLPYIQFPLGMGMHRAPLSISAPASGTTAGSRSSGGDGVAKQLGASRPPLDRSSSRHPITATTPSTALTVSTSSLSNAVGRPAPSSQIGETAEATTARTARALQRVLADSQEPANDFSGQATGGSGSSGLRRKLNEEKLAIVVPASAEEAAASDPAPIIRSPTKQKQSAFTNALQPHRGKGEAESAVAISSNAQETVPATNGSSVAVPFCVSSWINRKKLIVPVEQRIAQQHEDAREGQGGIGDSVFELAVAMQRTTKEVTAELQAKERAREEEEERRQAALEAAEAEKARQLLEEKAAELAANAQRRETREQRMERIRLERRFREQEKVAKQQQRVRERAAARLNISVDDLEADEQLLRAVEETSATVQAAPGPKSWHHTETMDDPTAVGPSHLPDGDDDMELTGTRRAPVRGGVFASAVISNEGIQREMEALAAVEASEGHQQSSASKPTLGHDGIRLRENDEPSDADEDEDGGYQIQQFVKRKKQRR